jgi:cell division protein FtsB
MTEERHTRGVGVPADSSAYKIEQLERQVAALRTELGELKSAYEELRVRFERFTYMPPELIEELERGSRIK